MKAAVGILTYQRPERLAASLPLVLAQVDALPPDVTARVIVIDNDPAGSARTVVESISHPRLRYVCEATPGIAAARNRALTEADDQDCLLFIDDDERPEPAWMSSLLATWKETGAAAVMGRVVSVFEHPLPPFVAAGDFFWRPRMPSGTPLEVVAAGNLLLDIHQVRHSGVRFDESLGLGGGEDTLFSRRLAALNLSMVWCDESAALDIVPPERLTVQWVLTRAWSHGLNTGRLALMLADGPVDRTLTAIRWMVGGIVRIVLGNLRWALGLLTRSMTHQARGRRAAQRGHGMIAGILGRRFEEYARADTREA